MKYVVYNESLLAQGPDAIAAQGAFTVAGKLLRGIRRVIGGAIFALTASIAVTGMVPSAAQAQDYILGEVVLMATDFCSRYTVPADGRLLNIDYDLAALFSLYGTQFGGDKRTTFGVPDMTGPKREFDQWGMRWCAATLGVFPSRPYGDNTFMPMAPGVIKTFGTNFCPDGWREAEVGFEPTVDFHLRRFSRPVHSTTLPLLPDLIRKGGI